MTRSLSDSYRGVMTYAKREYLVTTNALVISYLDSFSDTRVDAAPSPALVG
jgi:hypothetical protein